MNEREEKRIKWVFASRLTLLENGFSPKPRRLTRARQKVLGDFHAVANTHPCFDGIGTESWTRGFLIQLNEPSVVTWDDVQEWIEDPSVKAFLEDVSKKAVQVQPKSEPVTTGTTKQEATKNKKTRKSPKKAKLPKLDLDCIKIEPEEMEDHEKEDSWELVDIGHGGGEGNELGPALNTTQVHSGRAENEADIDNVKVPPVANEPDNRSPGQEENREEVGDGYSTQPPSTVQPPQPGTSRGLGGHMARYGCAVCSQSRVNLIFDVGKLISSLEKEASELRQMQNPENGIHFQNLDLFEEELAGKRDMLWQCLEKCWECKNSHLTG